MDLIIFDCDGTLVDSEFLCNLALQQQLAELGIDSDAEELMALYRGVKLNVTLTSLASEFDISFPENFIPDYRLKVKHLFELHLKANEGVKALLSSLTIPFCVASSAPREKIKQALAVTGLAEFFKDNIFSSYDIDTWKPEPGIFLHAAKKMNADPARCFVVEDSLVGLQAANGAKMKCIYYAPTLDDKHPLASIQIKHMSELMALLN
ncbi:HAD-IA family hydrolase [uncultured Psychromonas sp.]|uniref:HAD family hydrolase n=1 Tax=uncultured Psychromonas sp. TaxID=173974 RepID=UPI00263827DC|nr:HAD-IA family hydrolase [uncultured Psychromonas sp.]